MTDYFELADVTKRFGKATALDGVSFRVSEPSIVGLVGKNGSGKSTLLRHVVGLYLPTAGRCTTLGCPSATLGADELARIGMVHQHDTLLGWMRAEELLRYVASFYNVWDRELEAHLVELLEIERKDSVVSMSPGTRQKLALVIATCHHPELLLLDEPLSDLDPIVRRDVVEALLDRFRRDEVAIVISSHMLHDLERIADRIVCLDKGRIVADAPLDELKERYADWTVTSRSGRLPSRFAESYVVAQEGTDTRAHITVLDPGAHLVAFEAAYEADVVSAPLNLERIFRVLAGAESDVHTSVPSAH